MCPSGIEPPFAVLQTAANPSQLQTHILVFVFDEAEEAMKTTAVGQVVWNRTTVLAFTVRCLTIGLPHDIERLERFELPRALVRSQVHYPLCYKRKLNIGSPTIVEHTSPGLFTLSNQFLADLTGFEPATFSFRASCATNCATNLVLCAGLEPASFGVKGQRPTPLDRQSIFSYSDNERI